MDYFKPDIDVSKVNEISILGLAHVGDAVYELLVRTMVCIEDNGKVKELHKNTVNLVNAGAQNIAMNKIIDILDEDELALYRRGRNCKVNSVPKNSSYAEYHSATALEALFGWLYLQGKIDRIKELYNIIREE